MNADELIEQINERQDRLTKENKKYYDDILIYVRLSFDKSEQETEEILAEILDHILLAQEEGRQAADVFGVNPKMYLQEVIGELPRMITKKQSNLFMMVIFYFLASALTFYSLMSIGISFFSDLKEMYPTFHLGTLIVVTVISILAVFFLMNSVTYLLRWLCFRNIHKVLELLLYWVWGVVSIGVFLAILFLIPSFGPVIQVPLYVMLVIGLVFFAVARFTRKNL